ncbi:hypothetical protein OAG24_00705 [bacterium]|nr:hypothetical protein [bacterium]
MTNLQKYTDTLNSKSSSCVVVFCEELLKLEKHFSNKDEMEDFDNWVLEKFLKNFPYTPPELEYNGVRIMQIFKWLTSNLDETDENLNLVNHIYGKIICPQIKSRLGLQ